MRPDLSRDPGQQQVPVSISFWASEITMPLAYLPAKAPCTGLKHVTAVGVRQQQRKDVFNQFMPRPYKA